MNESYYFDWAFATINEFQRIVQNNFPQDSYRWPTLKSFDFEAFAINDKFVLIQLKDKISGIYSGYTGPLKKIITNKNTPKENPNISNLNQWQSYLFSEITIRPQDAIIIIPIPSIGRGNSVEEDWSKYTDEEKVFWHMQIEINITRQYYYIKGFDMKSDFLLPPGYLFLIDECKKLFVDHPDYNKNVFIMTRFKPGNKLLNELDFEIRQVLKEHNLNPLRADDKMYMSDRNLWNNVCVYMNCCKYGIAILEDRIVDEFNPNVAIEYGYMRALNKPVLLLVDSGFRNLRADIIGTLREQFDITDINGTIANPIITWLKELNLTE